MLNSLSESIEQWGFSDRAVFAMYTSVVVAGPLAAIFLPFVYWKPLWFAEAVFGGRGADPEQARLDEFGGAE